ncbi:MAG: polysaccharide biosynthesis protein [Clostridiales bacterium]|nr:polysaccharide biosynthesis protein [Clostridiales bacterium]
MAERKKQSFLQGALILSLAAVLTKVIGALFFKIPLKNLNSTAYGYFEATYNVYVPIYTVCTAGFPTAVSRMVSESIALGRYRDVKTIFRVAFRVFLVTGLVGTLLMLGLSSFYPEFVNLPNTRLTMIVMAPAILFCCLVSAYRGVYEGSRNMTPTAISQIVEAVGKLLFGLSLAAGALQLGQSRFAAGLPVYGRMAETAEQAVEFSLPYVAAGAMIGVTAGSFFALLYIMIRYRARGIGFTRTELGGAPPSPSSRRMFRSLLRVAIPVALGTLATQLTNMIDVVSLQKCLAIVMERSGDIVEGMYAAQIAADGTTDVLGFLTGNRGAVVTFTNLVPNVTLTFGISALPLITSAWALRDKRKLKSTVSLVLRITMLVATPCGIGLSVLARPIMRMVYDDVTAQVAGPMLEVMGIAVIFICLVAPINAMLQAVGRADIPAKIVLVGGAVKLLLNTTLVLNPYINIMGSAYSTLACYVVMVVLSLIALLRVVRVRLKWRGIFLKPLFSGVLCGVAAWAANGLLARIMPGTVATILAILIAGIVYVLLLLLLGAFTREDILMLPKGQKIAQILEKRGWIG